MLMKCPKDGTAMHETTSLLAPLYQTWFCDECAGLFYELTDETRKEEMMTLGRLNEAIFKEPVAKSVRRLAKVE